MTEEQKEQIDAMSHRALCSLWRFGEPENLFLQGEAGEYVKHRLFTELGGFTPAVSKSIGW